MKRNFLLLIGFLFTNLICAQFAASVDNTFNINNVINPSGGLATTQNNFGTSFPESVFLQSNGKVIVSRQLSPNNFRYNEFHDLKILRLNTDGSVDQSFHQNFDVFSSISVTKIIEYNNKLIMIGSFTFSDINIDIKKILVFNEDGTLDQNFVSPDLSNAISDVEVLSNGKIIISGFISYDINDQLVNGIVKLNLDGSIDSSFSVNSGFNLAIYCLEVQSDDKIIVGGNFTTFNGQTFNRLVRLNTDGSLDTSFNIGTGCNNIIYDIEIDNNGLILVGGKFTSYNSITTNNSKLIRLTNTGSRDLDFVVETTLFNSSSNYIRKILSQPNGDINIIYSADNSITSFNNNPKGLFYLTNTGATNTTKLTPDILKINNIALDSSNNIYLVGSFDYLRDAANTYKQINHIAKIDSNGALTNDFNRKMLGLNYYALVNVIEQQTDGKLLIGGDYFQFYNENAVKDLIRLNLDGTIDTSFNVGDFSGFVYVIKLLQDGKILIGGKFTITSNSIVYKDLVLLNSDGSVDPTFVHTINYTGQVITALDIQSTNNFVIGVSYQSSSTTGSSGKGTIIRILPNGQTDSSFSVINVSTNNVTKIKVLPNDKFIYSCGFLIDLFMSNLSNESGGIFKRNENGTTDATFTSPFFSYTTTTSTHNESVYDLDITEDNKIVAIGAFGKVNSIVSNKVIRLTENGIVDNSLSVGTGFNGAPYTLKCLSGGKILIGGNFLSYNNLNSKGLLRLNQDGSLDYSFNVGKGFSNKGVNKIFIQADNKILLGGFQFSYYNNYVASGLIRLIGGGNYSVTGSTKLDVNNNGGCDVNDVVFPNMKFNINNGIENFDFFADYSGNYKLDLNAGNYTISPIVTSQFTVSPPSITVQFPTQNTYFNQDYCLSSVNGLINDLNIVIIPLNNAIPGFQARYRIVFKNEGTIPRTGEIMLNFNGNLMSFSSTNFLQTAILPNQIKWNFVNLLPQEQRTIDVMFLLNTPTANPPLNSNDVLTFVSNITNDVDFTPNNNEFSLNQVVVNSYDPNDKTCLEGSVVGPEKIGDYVNYLIRFENTGTFPAQTVRVLDYIDTNKFDISTLKPVNSSHPMVVKISEVNKVEFIFNGINLPFDDANNDGYFVYKIKLKNDLNIGDTFSNTANIFFDYNSPIVTNTAVSTIAVLSLESTDGLSDISLYPNPTNDYITISRLNNNLINSIEVYNVSGQKMKISDAKNNSIDLSDF
ncbi:T9SS type A sorting domain-containing protein, partial [Flavobacterium terrigena]